MPLQKWFLQMHPPPHNPQLTERPQPSGALSQS